MEFGTDLLAMRSMLHTPEGMLESSARSLEVIYGVP